MSRWYRSGAVMSNTSLRNGGRIAGDGMAHDDYGDNSGYKPGPKASSTGRVRLPNDGVDPNDLNGPVVIIQPAKK